LKKGAITDAGSPFPWRGQCKDSGAADLEKQIPTAIITLLTSAIGFYLGSKAPGP